MRIALASAVPAALETLRSVLSRERGFRIVWTASDGAEAVQLAAVETPDLLLMSLSMPVLDGVEATRQIMRNNPCEVLMIAEAGAELSEEVYRALDAGAVDVVRTPALQGGRAEVEAAALLFKVRRLCNLPSAREEKVTDSVVETSAKCAGTVPLITIGASAGGPPALAEVLRGLPAGSPASIVIVQHLDERFAAGLAQWLGTQISLPVRLARDGEAPEQGAVLIAGTGDHLVIRRNGRLGYTPKPLHYTYRPSIDVFFHSVAEFWKARAIGLILTGMGKDGAAGLKAMRDAGHHTIVQDSDTSALPSMPRAAQKIGAAAQILPLPRIAAALLSQLASSSR